MAKYLLTSGTIRFKGSRGGGVFQKSGNVFTIRSRHAPVQKKSPGQTQANNTFESNAGRWRNLSAGQKASFNTNAPLYTRINSLGDTYTINGQQMQISTNQRRFFIQMTPVSTIAAPISAAAITQVLFGLDRPATSMILEFNATLVQTGTIFTLYCGLSDPTQRAFSKADCLIIGRLSAGQSTATKDWYNGYTAVYSPGRLRQFDWIPVYVEIVQVGSTQVLQTFQGWCQITN